MKLTESIIRTNDSQRDTGGRAFTTKNLNN